MFAIFNIARLLIVLRHFFCISLWVLIIRYLPHTNFPIFYVILITRVTQANLATINAFVDTKSMVVIVLVRTLCQGANFCGFKILTILSSLHLFILCAWFFRFTSALLRRILERIHQPLFWLIFKISMPKVNKRYHSELMKYSRWVTDFRHRSTYNV